LLNFSNKTELMYLAELAEAFERACTGQPSIRILAPVDLHGGVALAGFQGQVPVVAEFVASAFPDYACVHSIHPVMFLALMLFTVAVCVLYSLFAVREQ
jgi:hypothetical protein